MIQILVPTLALILSGSPPVPPADRSASDATCPVAAASNDGSTAELLLEEAKTRIAENDRASAQDLLRQALSADGESSARLGALRTLIAMQKVEELGRVEGFLGCVSSESRRLARAWIALRKEQYSEAAQLLESSVLPRHHMSPRWSSAHEVLGDAYAGLGRSADAQAQWRLALATDYDPGGTGYDPEALRRKLEAVAANSAGAEPLLPLNRYHDAISALDVASVQRTAGGVRYSKLVLLKNDEMHVAYGIDSYEVDCDRPRSRVLGVKAFDTSGNVVRELGTAPWVDDRPGDPFLPTERKLVCSLDPNAKLATPEKSALEMLRAYRAGEPVFE